MKKLAGHIGAWLLAKSIGEKASIVRNGMVITEALGKFAAQAAESKEPMMTSMVCKMGDSDVTLFRLWASTDGETPVTRIAELCKVRDAQKEIIEELRNEIKALKE